MKSHSQKRITISLVTYNSERHLFDFCKSLQAQTLTDWELLVIDNASSDASVRLVSEYAPHATIVRQKNNFGYARAHNLSITWSRAPYFLAVNSDIVFTPTCLEELLRVIEEGDRIASVAPKLLSWQEKSDAPAIIDSCGIALHRNYRAVDRYQGVTDRPLPDGRVFGASGACILLRRTALDDIKFAKSGSRSAFEFFDENFFLYKEDLDLAWRLNNAGWVNKFAGRAVAYHKRSLSGSSASVRQRRERKLLNLFSYRNHLLMIYKNHFWHVTLRQFIPILAFEVAKFVYLLYLGRSSLRGIRQFFALLPPSRMKRAAGIEKRRITAREFEQLLERPVDIREKKYE